ncbi:L-idonate 5-dehydrogenase [Slackia heliotrinireducens]|uniref:Theronine dehydrogenase-like Zn-dependent dehydrogenase n=1 Tax=Slackia heliotrinireducens (strain ATCC 29202 / DSM 20476 / NCTC 11029 / RHS 1) TaxID=471855 RepID=C7N6E8_SLAHD|nr:ribitol-5-phosphate dehydrogenase [Slackia heliotrinireducens]ACV22483.1 theronine dehydrogenase-like Zn-dependent dehydrogenase [Slackia heliotrinireducens DSM 20476]VEH00882.1 L-idonate 5-dehydrogenase [Slackia heliotrinireducens]
MLNNIYRLERPETFAVHTEELVETEGYATIRPTHLAICAADQRYWSGNRDPKALKKKLPMALIHEGIGVVVSDSTGTYAPGTKVVMVPNMPDPDDPDKLSKENYSRASKFCSSSMDGFMRDYVTIPTERLVPFGNNVDPMVAVMAELTSVATNAVEAFNQVRHVDRNNVIGIWGDGAVGYLMAMVLHQEFPDTHLILFGADEDKMAMNDFVDEKHNVRIERTEDLPAVDHAFECVGGVGGCTSAINQIIDLIRPQGVIGLMGVSEMPVPINTRMVLEKGLTLQGNSRSSKGDFERAVELFARPEVARQVRKIDKDVFPVAGIDDAQEAFRFDMHSPFKTVMLWDTPISE